MQLGLIGLGKMGSNMVKRLVGDGHAVVGYDLKKENIEQAEQDGAGGAEDLATLVDKLQAPRHVWVMVPHGKPTRQTIEQLLELLEPNDLIIDGGNSHYKESLNHAELCEKRDVRFLDVGVSGGVWGLELGYNLMIGGAREGFNRLEPVFKSLAPAGGYAHVGGHGAGHFVKMMHNALEYAMLQAIGEAFEGLRRSDFNIDLKQVADLWQHGSVVRCWLLELLEAAFEDQGNGLKDIADYVDDSGMGRWTTQYAVENAIPMPTITQSLYERFASRLDERFSAKVIAALRNQFGGHAVKEG